MATLMTVNCARRHDRKTLLPLANRSQPGGCIPYDLWESLFPLGVSVKGALDVHPSSVMEIVTVSHTVTPPPKPGSTITAVGERRRREMNLNPVVLSRLQFAWVIAFHFLLPAFTVGLASFIAVLEGLHLATGREIYFRISTFWIKIFAVSFGMGVVSGIVMPFQIGTNWSRFSDAVADVVSPLLAYEGLTAFFLEAAFLGVLLFGRNLVPRWAHFVAALMVALGTLFSTFWILATNSWMQTPAGYKVVDGRFEPVDWLQVIFNPSFPYRLAHTVDAVYITTGFVVVGVASSYLRSGRFVDESRAMLSMTLWLLTVLVPLQFFLGDAHGLNTLEHQPAKLAAIEAIWDTHSRAALNLFAIPDEKAETNRYELAVPDLGSLILTHDPNGVVRGLKDWPADERPSPEIVPFFGFRIMVGLALVMLAVVVFSRAIEQFQAGVQVQRIAERKRVRRVRGFTNRRCAQ